MKQLSLLVVVLLMTLSLSPAASKNAGAVPGGRVSFNDGWLFARFGHMPDGSVREEPLSLESPSTSDAGWRQLNVPHDWAIEGPFRKDLPSNTGKLPWEGIGWYRKHFTIQSADSGKCFFVDFDGAMSHAKVWLNGHFLGEWPYGYASFRFELTPYVSFHGDNILAVRLENPSGFSRWYPGGGIYRNVWLVSSSPVHVVQWGTTVTTPRVAPTAAVVHVRTEITNQTVAARTIAVKGIVTEVGGRSSKATLPNTTVTIPPGGTVQSEAEVTVKNPRLWDLTSPHLYVVRTVLYESGRVIDEASTTIGIRKAEFDPEKGFVLNGRRVKINGTCNHHDLGPLGAAINTKALERQLRILKEMGCNALRTSHNPPASELLDLCDRMGMLVLDESFDCWVQGKVENDYSSLFPAWHERDIRALVRRDRNHPCVIAWSCGNEVREQENGLIAGKLRAIFKSEDPTRPVTAACDNPKAGFDGFQDSVDIFGYNYKPRLYEKFRKENPGKMLFGSETASCISTNGEYIFPVSNDKLQGFANGQVSSYDLYAPQWATTPDTEFAAQDKNPSVAGEFVWTGFDYLGEPTPYSEDTSLSRSSYFGIVDLCGFMKDRFYLYQSRWRPELPMAHILPHWNWQGREGQVTPVHVYTSGDEAELFLNGQSLGRKKKNPFEYRIRWDSVRYEPGTLLVVAYRNGSEWARDVKETSGPTSGLSITAEDSVLNADGSDLAYFTVKAVDARGRVVPTADNLVHFRVGGPGVLAASANGDPTCLDSFQNDRYRLFHGQCLVIVRSKAGESGTISVSAESGGLTGGSFSVRSVSAR